ncbi:MAG: leucyl/phenylalanyl-tRNA--protein transferase [Chloroflexi bacterium]|nr:leucyl/phenylalanyl-tRNA--protein transferase [Chloroflexota bacterium]
MALVFLHRVQLRPERVLAAYRRGYYPNIKKIGFLYWSNPKKRAIIPLDERFHVAKRLKRKTDSHFFEVTFDKAFLDVIKECARLKPERQTTWISPEIIESFVRLHELGYAHSVEVWRDGRLVGGEYGVSIGGFYSGESMFHLEDYASRVALVYLVERLRERGFVLFDTQEMSPIASQCGGFEVERVEYHRLLADALSRDVRF